eukprot:scaffold178848_cov32-Tisochrysis_lutea.AAC.5
MWADILVPNDVVTDDTTIWRRARCEVFATSGGYLRQDLRAGDLVFPRLTRCDGCEQRVLEMRSSSA